MYIGPAQGIQVENNLVSQLNKTQLQSHMNFQAASFPPLIEITISHKGNVEFWQRECRVQKKKNKTKGITPEEKYKE